MEWDTSWSGKSLTPTSFVRKETLRDSKRLALRESDFVYLYGPPSEIYPSVVVNSACKLRWHLFDVSLFGQRCSLAAI